MSMLQLDEDSTLLQESEGVSGFLLLDRTDVQTSEVDPDLGFVVFDATVTEIQGIAETSMLLTDAPHVTVDVPEMEVPEDFILAFGRGPQGPQGNAGDEGDQGPAGPQGPPGEDPEDLPSMTIIFENGLF